MAGKTKILPDLSGHHEFIVAGWLVNPAALRMARGEHTVRLEPRVMQVLVFLVQNAGQVVPREELEAAVWQGLVVGYDAVANTINKLRKAFGDNSRQPHVIETISKIGYRLIAEVTLPTRKPNESTADAHEFQVNVPPPASKHRLVMWVGLGLFMLIVAAVAVNRAARQVPSSLPGQDRAVLSTLPSIAVLPFENVGSNEAQLNDAIPQLYFVKSQIAMYRGHLKEALHTLERAIDLKPSYADGYGMMAWILHFAGRPEEGLKAIEVAERLNPHISSVYHLVRGANLYAVEAYAEAVNVLETAADISPHHLAIRLWLTAAYVASGKVLDAEWQVEELAVQHADFSLSRISRIFPFKDPLYLARFTRHLRQAGLAD